jgi:hypothetical protein
MTEHRQQGDGGGDVVQDREGDEALGAFHGVTQPSIL